MGFLTSTVGFSRVVGAIMHDSLSNHRNIRSLITEKLYPANRT